MPKVKKNRNKDGHIQLSAITIPPYVHSALKEHSEKNVRSMKQTVVLYITQGLQRDGVLPQT